MVDPETLELADIRAAIETIHDANYVEEVIEGVCDEWMRVRPEMGYTAQIMFAGTQMLVEGMLRGDFAVGFNPQGAKHHAHHANSSGFCVFNDMAWAALKFEAAGLRPLYLDWDIHAGDGVQHLLEETFIPTLSIHNHSLFPGDPATVNRAKARDGINHSHHDPSRAIYNWGISSGEGDEALLWALGEAAEIIREYKPGVILLATGADGHGGESNLGSSNAFTYRGFEQAADLVAELANECSDGRVLIGGAGGYQPLNHTPRIWAKVVETIYNNVNTWEGK